MELEQRYNSTLAIMKGIAIFFVVWGHAFTNTMKNMEIYVNQFHLAAFFFVSGYFFKEKYIEDKRTFVRKKVKKLYVLFVISGLTFLLFRPLLEMIHVYGSPLSWNDYGAEIINLVFRLTSNNPMMGAMWFCPALLGVSLLAFGLFCVSKGWSLKSRTALFAVAVIIGGGFLHVLKLKSPYCVWQYLIITGIYYMGWLFHQVENNAPKWKLSTWIIQMSVSGVALFFFTEWKLYGALQPASIKQESVVSIMLVAMTGCAFVYSMAKVVAEAPMGKVLAMIGDYSFSIMLLHFLSFKVVNYAYCGIHHLPLQEIASFPTMKYENYLWFVMYLMAGVFIPIFLSKIYHTCREKLVS